MENESVDSESIRINEVAKGETTLDEVFEPQRRQMVVEQLARRGIRSTSVLQAMERVPRHLFVPSDLIGRAYADEPLPIGEGQTISQPYIVAAMSEALCLRECDHVLEVGTGSAYQTAVLALLSKDVVSIEKRAALAQSARERLASLQIDNVIVEVGDGWAGSERGPFDAILVAAAAPKVPLPLIDQLAEEGRLVIPIGAQEHQELMQVTKRQGKLSTQKLLACRFVPLAGKYGWTGEGPS